MAQGARNHRLPITDPIQKMVKPQEFYNSIRKKILDRTNEYPCGLISNQKFFQSLNPYEIFEYFNTFKKNLNTIANRLGYANFKVLNGLEVDEIKVNDSAEIIFSNNFSSSNIEVVDLPDGD